MQRQRISIDQIYDMLAMRVIITQSESDCYAVLGIIHNQWRPVPGRIKDFIAMPRPISTSRCTPRSSPKKAMPSKCRSAPKRCTRWPKKASRRTGNTRTARSRRATNSVWPGCGRWSSGSATCQELQGISFATLKIDLYPEEVYTFTPKGRIVILPRDATPIDFAYTVHTEVGHTCVGAKVNGRIVAAL
jgi:GTP diphosphokinase / guanosine-3',5'-bis(diphosphate) 3'-diphosphatase